MLALDMAALILSTVAIVVSAIIAVLNRRRTNELTMKLHDETQNLTKKIEAQDTKIHQASQGGPSWTVMVRAWSYEFGFRGSRSLDLPDREFSATGRARRAPTGLQEFPTGSSRSASSRNLHSPTRARKASPGPCSTASCA